MAKPITYFQKHWAELVLFLDDGRIDLDSSSVDRMFKSTTLLLKKRSVHGKWLHNKKETLVAEGEIHVVLWTMQSQT